MRRRHQAKYSAEENIGENRYRGEKLSGHAGVRYRVALRAALLASSKTAWHAWRCNRGIAAQRQVSQTALSMLSREIGIMDEKRLRHVSNATRRGGIAHIGAARTCGAPRQAFSTCGNLRARMLRLTAPFFMASPPRVDGVRIARHRAGG